MKFLLRYRRALAIAAGIALLLALGSHALSKAEQRGYERAQSEYAAGVAKANASTAALEQRQREQSQKAAAAWETERNELQGQVVDLLARRVSVRVCKPAASSGQLPSAAPAAGSFDGAAWPIEPTVRMGEDVGGRVVQLAGECERYREQLSILQNWILSVQ